MENNINGTVSISYIFNRNSFLCMKISSAKPTILCNHVRCIFKRTENKQFFYLFEITKTNQFFKNCVAHTCMKITLWFKHRHYVLLLSHLRWSEQELLNSFSLHAFPRCKWYTWSALQSMCTHRVRGLWQHGASTEKCYTAGLST